MKPVVISSSLDGGALPAARTLARMEWHARGVVVHLPARFARATVEKVFELYRAHGRILEPASAPGVRLTEREWAIEVFGPPFVVPFAGPPTGLRELYVYPRHAVVMQTESAARVVLYALEQVKPDEVDAEGRPISWIADRSFEASVSSSAERDDDAVELPAGAVLPEAEERADDSATITSEEIRARFLELLERVRGLGPSVSTWAPSLPVPQLSLWRGGENRLGLVTGRVWYHRDRSAVRIRLSTCPTSDWAELLATMLHELAHPLSRGSGHDDPFKRTLVALAEGVYGQSWFVEARARLGQSHHVVDAWVTTGIRAALRGGDPPVAREADDGQLARVLAKIRKLRELGADQLGRPESIAATAAANDLITTHGLGGYDLRISAAIDEQMVDRWVVMPDGAVWRRLLAHSVARYCSVFALALRTHGRMHFFGLRADVMGAEYLYAVVAARIERECDAHLVEWKKRRGKTTSADSRRERTAFCDCATMELDKKLRRIAEEEGRTDPTSSAARALVNAEALARVEHEKRGGRWTTGGGKQYRENEAGRAAGRAIDPVRGVDAPPAKGPKLLPSG